MREERGVIVGLLRSWQSSESETALRDSKRRVGVGGLASGRKLYRVHFTSSKGPKASLEMARAYFIGLFDRSNPRAFRSVCLTFLAAVALSATSPQTRGTSDIKGADHSFYLCFSSILISLSSSELRSNSDTNSILLDAAAALARSCAMRSIVVIKLSS